MGRIQLNITSADGGSAFRVHVVPRSRKNEISGRHDQAVKIRLTAPPVEGKANEALIEFLAKRLDVPKRNIEILSGASSRDKMVCVFGLTPQELEARLIG
ncbi:MAG: YggU family protein [Ardenticatenia bacterium]|nr:YggU family protein [Ardenticatenia bacterium]